MIEGQGIDVLCRGIKLSKSPPYSRDEGWLYASGKEAVGSISPPADPFNPSGPLYWKFRAHQFVTTEEAYMLAMVFDPSYNIQSTFLSYEDTVFPMLATTNKDNIWTYYPKPNGLLAELPLIEFE